MAQAIRTAAPVKMLAQPFLERRRAARSGEVYARRRLGQVAHLHQERRGVRGRRFDVAAALELNLDRFPTKTGMLTLLRSWLYVADREGLGETRPAYTVALSHAARIMEQSSGPVAAIALLRARNRQKDPIMAIISLGQPGVPTTYDFDSPFDIVSQGSGSFGGSATALTELAGDVLRGTEGYVTIQFLGTFPEFSWTVPTPENWHGFTFGIRTTERLEPGPGPSVPTPPSNGVPEPGTLTLAGLALAVLFVKRRRKG